MQTVIKPGVVLRADFSPITIGRFCRIEDDAIIRPPFVNVQGCDWILSSFIMFLVLFVAFVFVRWLLQRLLTHLLSLLRAVSAASGCSCKWTLGIL